MKKNNEDQKIENIEDTPLTEEISEKENTEYASSQEEASENDTESNTDDITTKLIDAEKSLAILKEELLASKANLINTISRMRKEEEKTVIRRENSILIDFLNIIEYFNAGVTYGNNIPNKSKELDNLLLGFKMVETQLNDFLSSKSISKFDSLNQNFDPKKHNPIKVIHSNECTISTVTKQFTAGYTRRDVVIRLSSVEVTLPSIEKQTSSNEDNKNNSENTQ